MLEFSLLVLGDEFLDKVPLLFIALFRLLGEILPPGEVTFLARIRCPSCFIFEGEPEAPRFCADLLFLDRRLEGERVLLLDRRLPGVFCSILLSKCLIETLLELPAT